MSEDARVISEDAPGDGVAAATRARSGGAADAAMNASGKRWTIREDAGGPLMVLTGDWIARDGAGAETGALSQAMASFGKGVVSFDTRGLGRWDSALLVFIAALRQTAREKGLTLDDKGLPPATLKLLALMPEEAAPDPPEPPKATLVRRVGRKVIAFGRDALDVVTMVGEVILRGGNALRGRVRMRRVDLLTYLYDAGVGALPIVTIVNLLVGGILAFVGAVQLRKFGADIYIAALVGLAVVREMAALMTAIVMAGRTGGAYAANIATMQGSEEIDALRAIGIPIQDYLILPRMISLTVMMPLLYLYASTVGIFGGFIVAVAMLNLSPETFVDQLRLAVEGNQIIFGLVKSVTFGMLIAFVGCRSGLKAGRSAADVGQAATGAVVICIVGVIALDAVFAICANALDF